MPSLRNLRRVASLLDARWTIPGTSIRFGLDPLVGLIPGIGDVASASISLYVVVQARRLGVPDSTILRMLGNVAIDAASGAFPVVGDVFDVAFKANVRNLALIEEHLDSEGTA